MAQAWARSHVWHLHCRSYGIGSASCAVVELRSIIMTNIRTSWSQLQILASLASECWCFSWKLCHNKRLRTAVTTERLDSIPFRGTYMQCMELKGYQNQKQWNFHVHHARPNSSVVLNAIISIGNPTKSNRTVISVTIPASQVHLQMPVQAYDQGDWSGMHMESGEG